MPTGIIVRNARNANANIDANELVLENECIRNGINPVHNAITVVQTRRFFGDSDIIINLHSDVSFFSKLLSNVMPPPRGHNKVMRV